MISLIEHVFIEYLPYGNTTPTNVDTVMNNTDKNSCSHGAYILEGVTDD